MRPALRRRLRESVPTAILAAVIYIPLLLTRPGRVGADTKTYLYLDPDRMLGRAWSMWDPNIGMGTVTHQNIGYLWPIGPWYWLFEHLGAPDWVAQRLWLGTILFLAGVGVRFMLKAMGQEGPHVTAATFVYALTPYVLSLAARLSVILLPYTGLPWMIGLTVLALRRPGWRYPALFGLVVATIGSVNATALLLAGVGPVLWIAHEVVITREVRLRRALATTAQIGVMTIGCSLWWMAGLWAQGGYGIDILRYTETAETVATASLSLEVLRGLGYWFFYGEDRYGPWIAPSRSYTQSIPLLFASYVLPGLGLLGAAFTRFRERAFFLLLLVTGLFLAVGAHPWDDPAPAGQGVKAFLQSQVGLSMRSLPRAAPLVVLALAVFVGTLVAAAARNHRTWARPMTAGVAALAVLALPPLWRGQMVDENLDRAEDVPSYWVDAARAMDARDDGTRVLELPGEDFASYRWGTTVDPVTPGLMDRPYVARELIPYGSPPSADVLNAVDRRFQELVAEPDAIAPMARFMAVGDISVRSDLTYERYNTPRPRRLWALLTGAPDLGKPTGFGGTERNVPRPDLPMLDEQELLTPADLVDPPKVGLIPVEDAEKIVRTSPTSQPIVMAGDAEGIVDLAGAGLVTGHELLLYSGTFADDPQGLRDTLKDRAVLVLTDTDRRQARRWGTVRDNTGITERPGEKALEQDPKDQRLDVFPLDATDDIRTVTDARGGVWAQATSYGNSVSLTPEDDPNKAVDDDINTAWRTGGFSSATGESIRLEYAKALSTDHIDVLQAQGGVRNRFITEVELRFDGGAPQTVALDKSSRDPGTSGYGQRIRFPHRTFRTLQVTITATDPGDQRRYDGISSVGFAEIRAVDDSGRHPVADNVIRLPRDLLATTGKASQARPLAIVLTRQRVAGTVAVRSDPEPSMARTWSLPTDRDFTVVGQVRLSNSATDDLIDRTLGIPSAEDGGVTATSKRRLPGGLDNRASNAIDGDPSTWYSPGFLDQHGEYLDYQVAKPISFDHFDLTVLNDGRHSVPQILRLEVDGTPVQRIQLPKVGDIAEPGHQHTFHVELDKRVEGKRITLAVEDALPAVRDVNTLDWFTDKPLVMPMGIAELAIPGLRAPAVPKRVDSTCRTDLVHVDGKALPVSLRGTTADLLAGKAIDLVACEDQPLALAKGTTTLRTQRGGVTGLDVDRLVLRSAAGGGAGPATGPLVDPANQAKRPALRVTHQTRTSTDLVVPKASKEFWLVLNQSHNLGWHATADGKDLGAPTLVNGYANGWRVPAGTNIDIHVEWRPQRTVDKLLGLSVAFVVAAIVLAAWPRRRRRSDDDGAEAADDDARWIPLEERPAMPLALDWGRSMRYAGPTPSTFAWIATTLAAAVAGYLFVGPLGALLLGIVALVALRVPRARPLLTIGGPAIFAGAVAWMLLRQVFDALPPGFDWPTYFEGAQAPAWIAVLLLLLDAVIDRCWLRRWWPTDNDRG
ncbi:MAG: alpha-(1-_3)-arabinofuranosyltransferase family protein [Acidimicrobiales bacterium]